MKKYPSGFKDFLEALGADVAIPVSSPEEAFLLYLRRRGEINGWGKLVAVEFPGENPAGSGARLESG